MPRGRPRKNAAAVGGATAAPTKKAKTRANGKPQVPFVHKLALNQWLLSLFNVKRFEPRSARPAP